MRKNADRFNGVTEEELYNKSLDDRIDFNLDIIFVSKKKKVIIKLKSNCIPKLGEYKSWSLLSLQRSPLLWSWEPFL